MRTLRIFIALAACLAACQPTATPTGSPSAVAYPEAAHVTEDDRPTKGPLPESRPTADKTSTGVPFDMANVPVVYGSGAVPEGAVARIGIGALAAPFSLAGDDDWDITQSPDGTQLAIGTEAGVYVYNTADMTELWKVATPYWVGRLEWSPDGTMLAGMSGQFFIWDAASGNAIAQITPENWIRAFAWAPSSKSAALVLFDSEEHVSESSIVLFDIDSQKTRLLWSGPRDEYSLGIADVAWSADGGLIAAPTNEDTISLINTEDGTVVHQLRFGFYNVVRRVVFSPDGKLLAAWADHHHTSDQRVPIWDVNSGELLQTLTSDFSPFLVKWSSDSTLIASGTPHVAVDIWNARTGEQRAYIDLGQADIHSLRWSVDGQSFVAFRSVSDDVVRWDAATREMQTATRLDGLEQLPFISRGRNPGVIVWDTATAKPSLRFTTVVPRDVILWSPDGNSLAVRSRVDDEKPQVMLFDAISGEQKSLWRLPEDALDWARDAFLTGQNSSGCQKSAISSGIRSGDGRVKALASVPDILEFETDARMDISIRLTENESGKILNMISEGPYPVCTMAFSPDGRYLAVGHRGYPISMHDTFLTGADASFISIREALTGRLVARFTGHTGSVYALAWSPQGTMLASISFDGTAIIWRVPTDQ